MAFSCQDYDIPRLAMVDHIGDRFFPVTDLHIFSVSLGDAGLDIVDDILRFLKSGIV